MDGWLWETLFQPWIRNFQKQDEWWCPAPAVETPSTSEISNKDGNRNLWKTLKAFFSRVINLLLTKLARDRTGRISALGLFCTDLAALGPYCQDLGPIFSQYGPRAWLIRYIYSIVSEIVYMRNYFIHELENDRGAVETSFVFLITCFYNKMFC